MYRGFIKEVTNLAGLPIGNADLRVREMSIKRDILTSATSEFTVLSVPEQAEVGNIFGCYDEYGKVIYLGVITGIEDKTLQTNQIIALFNDKWLWNNPENATIEQTVKTILQNDFQNSSDSLMRTIFSQFDIVINSSGTSLVLPSQKENYVISFMEFIFKLYESYQILLDINIHYNAIRPTITILKPSYPTLKLTNNNYSLTNFNVIRETYEINKLILYSRDGVLRGTWYGTTSGISTDSASTDRLPKIKTNIVFSDDPVNDIIADNLSNQMYNHKIEVDLLLNSKLYNFDDFNLGQTFEITYEGETYESVLTGYSIKINENGKSDYVSLTFGIVRVDLVDKLNRLVVEDTDTASYSTQAKEDSEGNVITDTYVKKSGDTMTGALTVNAAGVGARLVATDSQHSGQVRMGWASNHQTHGLFSTGYSTDGTTWAAENMWLIYRNATNSVQLNGGKVGIDASGNLVVNGSVTTGGTVNGIIIPDDLFYKDGDTITLTTGVLTGWVTGSTKTLQLYTPLAKRLDNITSVTITKFIMTARGISGYVEGSTQFDYTQNTDYTLSATIDKNTNGILFKIDKASRAYTGATNNTVVTALIRNIVLELS